MKFRHGAGVGMSVECESPGNVQSAEIGAAVESVFQLVDDAHRCHTDKKQSEQWEVKQWNGQRKRLALPSSIDLVHYIQNEKKPIVRGEESGKSTSRMKRWCLRLLSTIVNRAGDFLFEFATGNNAVDKAMF